MAEEESFWEYVKRLVSNAAFYAFFTGEHVAKKVLFGCQSCGQCALSYTAYTCPMRCPKNLRNGPCGGVRPGGKCEVYPERSCIWYLIYQRTKFWNRLERLLVIHPKLDWRLEETSSWLNSFKGLDDHVTEAYKAADND